MITYDYFIERNMGKGKTAKFKPGRIPTRLKNIVVIEGPNSSAKSTLLNIIALGLFGTRSSRINPILQTQLNSLLDQEHQKIRFSFEINSGNEELTLKSEKADINGNEIIVKESMDGKIFHPLSCESFQRKYNLIYDIPNNPTERLPELLKELKDEQLQFGNCCKNFGFYLRNIINEINSSRNPKRLETLRKKLFEEERKKKEILSEIPKLEDFLNDLETNAYVEYFYYYSNAGECLSIRKNQLEREIKKIKKDGKQITTILSRNRNKIGRLRTEFTECYKELTPLIQNVLPKKEKTRFQIWKDVNPYSTGSNELKTLKIESNYLEDLFDKELKKLKKDKSFTDAKIMEKLFHALDEFEDSMLMIPELEVTIGQLVGILKKELNKSSILIAKSKTLEKISTSLIKLKETMIEIETTQKALEKEAAASEEFCEEKIETFDEKKSQLDEMENDLLDLATKCNGYLQRCISKGFSREKLESTPFMEMVKEIHKSPKIKQYLSLGEEQVLDDIGKLHDEISGKKSQLDGLEIVITQYQKDVKNLENQKPHKFEDYIDALNELLRKTESVSQKILSEYNTNLNNLMKKKVKENSKITKDEKRYYNEVSKYLANRIGSFRHIDKVYKAEIVDLISGKIFTDSEEMIYISDIGTGQSQSAYVLSLLNIKNDNRKIIALFDEIAMMDDESLKPIYAKMRELYLKNQLLLGILVQRSNELKIKEII